MIFEGFIEFNGFWNVIIKADREEHQPIREVLSKNVWRPVAHRSNWRHKTAPSSNPPSLGRPHAVHGFTDETSESLPDLSQEQTA